MMPLLPKIKVMLLDKFQARKVSKFRLETFIMSLCSTFVTDQDFEHCLLLQFDNTYARFSTNENKRKRQQRNQYS